MFSFHTHTTLCDGTAEATTMALAAWQHHYTHLGFSAHAPLDMRTRWHMPWNRIDEYVTTVRNLQASYQSQGH